MIWRLAEIIILRVLVGMTVLGLTMIRPMPICGSRFLLCMLDDLSRRIESNGKCVGFDDELCLDLDSVLGIVDVSTQLWEVLEQILLPLLFRFVLLCAVGWLLRLCEMLVEDSEVYTRHPYGTRPLKRCTEHTTLLNILPFACKQV